MKITYSILGLLVIAILVTWANMPEISSDHRKVSSLPWIIKTDHHGGSSVFGLDIKRSTVGQAQSLFNDEVEFAVFEDSNGAQSLEAFFNYTQIAGLQARITLTIEAGPEELRTLISQAIEKKGQPSNSYKYVLPTDLHGQLLNRPFNSMTYQPKINIEDDVLHARFGRPENTRQVDEQTQQWLYPEKGLSILVAKDEKPVFQYVRPDQFNLYFGHKNKGALIDKNEATITNDDSDIAQEEQNIGKN